MDLGLKHKTALVTGSSRGLGRIIAREFLLEGARVCLVARGEKDLFETEKMFQSRFGKENVRAIVADLTDPKGIKKCANFVEATWGELQILVANAGNGRGGVGLDTNSEDWHSLINLNLVSPALLVSSLYTLLKQKGGNIVLVSSIAAREVVPAPVPYSAAKLGLMAITKNYARWLAKDFIRINMVCPGNILTPGGIWDQKLAENREAVEKYIASEVPLGRFATGEEIAHAVLFLASERASFMTGSTLVVDGGQTRGFS